MTIVARRSLLSSLVVSTNAELSHQDTISFCPTSKSGLTISSPPDSSDISSSQPPKEFSLTRSAEKDTLEERSSASSIEMICPDYSQLHKLITMLRMYEEYLFDSKTILI